MFHICNMMILIIWWCWYIWWYWYIQWCWYIRWCWYILYMMICWEEMLGWPSQLTYWPTTVAAVFRASYAIPIFSAGDLQYQFWLPMLYRNNFQCFSLLRICNTNFGFAIPVYTEHFSVIAVQYQFAVLALHFQFSVLALQPIFSASNLKTKHNIWQWWSKN